MKLIISFIVLFLFFSYPCFLNQEIKTAVDEDVITQNHFLYVAGGTRGDTQPLISLAYHMLTHHDVQCTFAASPEMRPIIESIGCKMWDLDISWKYILEEDKDIRDAVYRDDQDKFIEVIGKYFQDPEYKTLHLLINIIEKNIKQGSVINLIIGSSLEWASSYSVAQYYGIKVIINWYQPLPFSEHIPPCNFFDEDLLEDSVNYYELSKKEWGMFYDDQENSINNMRVGILGLDPMKREEFFDIINGRNDYSMLLLSYSPIIIPNPPDWTDDIKVTGYFITPKISKDHPHFGENINKGSSELTEFLNSGPAPIYIGWGSMNYGKENSPALIKEVVLALKKANKRGVISKGWQGIDLELLTDDDLIEYANENCINVESVSHEWLMPQCEGILVHGGAGSTAAALRSGKPIIISPFLGDQPFWASRISKDSKSGIRVSSMASLKSQELAEAIFKITTDESIISNAKQIGSELKHEDGCTRAAEYIFEYLSQ
eukprot:TRINITY_DN2710_c0_g1_i2.p1 TRINITY_DN2710_c0_g1~~TRINITY_DN2710_c0_g1_i2.p1  ORF type:complete len:489 (-),score=140.92 TRINITY_DN2710_c0_g1_i2:75-1541(-)